ncbi:uncharacterized protein LOC106153947 [Lingula anatina]|uniref:Uncharacterized protein LOC106153947 n=1 Tax=Lingula anatina TaxID=7574 RepID=A0A1S3HC03_LINAN|nr:uncharacterized protein LOC106153947 [Lingula anatina]|eukprot:XP_013383557.1 uncharacterized protein LOC106153947 [Lingula anatina]
MPDIFANVAVGIIKGLVYAYDFVTWPIYFLVFSPVYKLSKSNRIKNLPINPSVPEDLESIEFKKRCSRYASSLKQLTRDEIDQVEKETRGQADNENWFKHRKGRITASLAGAIYKQRDCTPPDGILKQIFQYQPRLNLKALEHGKKYETVAVDMYKIVMSSCGNVVDVLPSGVTIDFNNQFIAASVDGVVKSHADSHQAGNLEIKCPYVEQNVTLEELAIERKSFYLSAKSDCQSSYDQYLESPKMYSFRCEDMVYVNTLDCNLNINTAHNYYIQIQVQMGVTDRQWCDFVVFLVDQTRLPNVAGQLFIQRVLFDRCFYQNELVPKFHKFYLTGIVPELLTQRVKNGRKLYPNSSKYKYK